jgi:hypothetical protein
MDPPQDGVVRYPTRPILTADTAPRPATAGRARPQSAPAPPRGAAAAAAGDDEEDELTEAALAAARAMERGGGGAQDLMRALMCGDRAGRSAAAPADQEHERAPRGRSASAGRRLYDQAAVYEMRQEDMRERVLRAEREAREWVAPRSAEGVAPRVYMPRREPGPAAAAGRAASPGAGASGAHPRPRSAARARRCTLLFGRRAYHALRRHPPANLRVKR